MFYIQNCLDLTILNVFMFCFSNHNNQVAGLGLPDGGVNPKMVAPTYYFFQKLHENK